MWKAVQRWLTIGAVSVVVALGFVQVASAAAEILKRDDNRVTVSGAITNDASQEVRNLRVDATTNRLLVSDVSSSASNFTTVYTARKTVATAGTPEQLPSQAVTDGQVAAVKAMHTNTNPVYVASSSGGALRTGSTSFRLQPGESFLMQLDNFNRLWVDVDTNGEGVELIML